jgi:hypothetical protein
MSSYAKMLEDMQSAMLDAAPGIVISSLKSNCPSLNKRLDIYISGYRSRLVQAVLSDYPTLVHYLGNKQAESLALSYVECTQSSSYTLDVYPFKFAEYIFKSCNDSFVIALAKLESTIAEVFWRPDSKPYTPPTDSTPEQFMELCFAPRKALKLIHLEYQVEEYMLAVREGRMVAASDIRPHEMLIVRHNNEVRRHIIENTEKIILLQLFSGIAVGEALEEITVKYPNLIPEIEKKLQFWFVRWIQNGFFAL